MRIIIGISVIAACLLSGCSLLVPEQEYDTAVMVSMNQPDYQFAWVTRGDLLQTEKIVCAYMPVAKEDFFFDYEGEDFAGIYVNQGDTVFAGQLLAQLYISDLEQNIRKAEAEVSTLNLHIKHLREQKELAVERQTVILQGLSEIQRNTQMSVEAVETDYEDQVRMSQTRLELLNSQITLWKEEVERRSIYASFGGTVSYVAKITAGSKSALQNKVVTIIDNSKALFEAKTDRRDFFEPGMEFIVSVDQSEYNVAVVDPSELEMKASDQSVYFEVQDPLAELNQKDKGTVTIVVDQREDVLYLPAEAVTSIDGKSVVYYLNEEKIPEYKQVTTGLIAGDYIEIIDGVVEGESIIVN
ncbi:MAG: efflux transporter, family, subunit [Herbinix sp.]|jgi:multidrug efflux pump subunit AcrA (membrane-fusion protein)|nr:efflux transporter, family, subunit [Herbinix sp.]